jgi:UDP-N-acetylglucosamine 2-epimerase
MFELLDQSGKAIIDNRKLLTKYALKERNFLYLTFHRAANVDSRANLRQVIESVACQPFPVLFSVHPRTRARLIEFRLINKLKARDNTFLVEPLNYLDNLTAVRFARAVLTDSGGLQKESLFLGTPVLTLREETEWQETLSMGNRLVGLDKRKITEALESPPIVKTIKYRVRGKKPSQIIVSELSRFLRG